RKSCREQFGRKRLRLFVEPLEQRMLLTMQTINVTTTADEVSPNGLMSLREAILQANAIPASDTAVINLQAGATYSIERPTLSSHIPLQIDTEGSILDPSYGDFDITRSMVIEGNGGAIQGESLGRIFQISGGGNVTINNLSVLNGGGPYISQGAGIYVS